MVDIKTQVTDSSKVIIFRGSVSTVHFFVCFLFIPDTDIHAHTARNLPVRKCQCETGVFGRLMAAGAQSERVDLI